MARACTDSDEARGQHGDQRATVLSLVNTQQGVYVALLGLVIGWVADRSYSTTIVILGPLALGGVLARRSMMSVS